ncbi:helicase-related protein, partial [Paracoccaceae bacterium]|nr:helicase-related protein [Paracoccaceae bacterium]
FLQQNSFFFRRLAGLKRILETEFHDRAKFVIFVSCRETADYIFRNLSVDYPESCFRHSLENDNWIEFTDKIYRAILVCDETAEEGLNIQGANRYIIHFDLPLNVNRIEQRMGRIDRYGGDDALKSFIILNRSDKFEVEWAKLLSNGVKIFDQSVASLQYLIEDHLTGEKFKEQILGGRAEFISNIKSEFRGENGIISNALKQLQQEDKLEEIADPPEHLFYELISYDAASESIQNSCQPWIENHLKIGRSDRRAHIFEYGYVNSPDKKTILNRDWLAEVKKFEAKATGVPSPVFTYNRKAGNSTAAQKPSLLRFGNTFLDSIFSTTGKLPLGKTSMTWIYNPLIKSILSDPIFVMKSHVIVEVDAIFVKRKTKNWTGSPLNLTDGIIQRRCDALFPPTYDIVKVSNFEDILQDRTICTILDAIDELVESNIFVEDGFKFDFESKNLKSFYYNFPGAQNWNEFVLNLSKISRSELNEKHLQRVDEELPSYRQKLDKRLNRYKAILDPRAMEFEENLNEILIEAVKNPLIRFVASEGVILSGDRALTRKIMA